MPKNTVQWANPGALGLGGFGFTTILLQIHNIGLIDVTLPVIYGRWIFPIGMLPKKPPTK